MNKTILLLLTTNLPFTREHKNKLVKSALNKLAIKEMDKIPVICVI